MAIGGYFDQNLLEAKSVENVDFTDAVIPPKILPVLCDRPDTKGTNPTTGVETRDSLMCPWKKYYIHTYKKKKKKHATSEMSIAINTKMTWLAMYNNLYVKFNNIVLFLL